jgi:hypothetical protein
MPAGGLPASTKNRCGFRLGVVSVDASQRPFAFFFSAFTAFFSAGVFCAFFFVFFCAFIPLAMAFISSRIEWAHRQAIGAMTGHFYHAGAGPVADPMSPERGDR